MLMMQVYEYSLSVSTAAADDYMLHRFCHLVNHTILYAYCKSF